MGAAHKNTIPVLLRQCATLANQHIDNMLKQHDLARSQYRVLYQLAQHGELSQKALAELMAVTPATITPLVETLERKGLVARSRDAADRRSNTLTLSAAGRKQYDAIPDPVALVEHEVSQVIGPDQLAVLKTQLTAIATALTNNV